MNTELFKFAVPLTSLLGDPKFDQLLGRKCRISYRYESEREGFTTAEQLVFDGVESFKCTYFVACDLDMLEAYGRVVDVGRSLWLKGVTRNLSQASWNSKDLMHLRIFFDDGPCYEFICRSFDVLNEEVIASPNAYSE